MPGTLGYGVSETFTCETCEQTFEKEWSDEEAEAESSALFGHLPDDERAVLCDDCFGQITFGKAAQLMREAKASMIAAYTRPYPWNRRGGAGP